MIYADKFKKQYGFDALEMLDKLNLKYLEILKKVNFEYQVKKFVKEEYGVEVDDTFLQDLFNVVNEADVSFPQKQKIDLPQGQYPMFNKAASIPKSKGLYLDFQQIVSDDSLRPSMTGVYVTDTKPRFLVGTDAHILVKKEINSAQVPSEYNGKIINLKILAQSKGMRFDFIDERYPEVDRVIPTDNQLKRKNCSTYAFYNFAKSGISAKKLIGNIVFHLRLKYEDVIFKLNPIILSELMGYWLMQEEESFTIEIQSDRRAIVMRFSDENLGLIMPVVEDGESEVAGTEVYSLDDIEKLWGGGKVKKSGTTKPKEKKIVRQKPQEKTEYKKYEGDLKSDSIYISRRKIDYVMLLDGEKIDASEMIDGIYKIKK